MSAAEGDYKIKIVQRGAVPPLIEMLKNDDPQLREMAAFALGRLAQHYDNQAGIVACGGLAPLLDLLESDMANLQHNAAFALYGLSENEDNLAHFVQDGIVHRILDAKLIIQASRDCVNKTIRRLQDKLEGRTLRQLLYVMQGAPPVIKQRIAFSLGKLCTEEQPSPADMKLMLIDKKALDVLLNAVVDSNLLVQNANVASVRHAATALFKIAGACGAAAQVPVEPAPPEPRVFLGAQYVNNPTLSDVTFVVEEKKFYAHRIALLASSDIFKSMFDGHYREKEASTIPIPNIRWEVFEAMMHCIYTGSLFFVYFCINNSLRLCC